MDVLSINLVAFTILAYPISYIELIATFFGLISVYLATRPSIFTWPTGIVNEFGFFILFFQVQLYSDMLLQVFFFVVTVYGWVYWRSPNKKIEVTYLNHRVRMVLILALLIFTVLLGALSSRLHILLPEVFPNPASYPYVDAFTTIASMIAMILLARKNVESWVLWVIVDIVSIGLYVLKGIHLVAIEYVVFLGLASFGLYQWAKKVKQLDISKGESGEFSAA